VNPDAVGTKAAFHYHLGVAAGAEATIELRLSVAGHGPIGTDAATTAPRKQEADEFYRQLTPAACTDDEALVLRQALAGIL
jgi:hypothetical protein